MSTDALIFIALVLTVLAAVGLGLVLQRITSKKRDRWPNRCRQTDSPLGELQRCQRPLGHDGLHDYGNAAVRRRKP